MSQWGVQNQFDPRYFEQNRLVSTYGDSNLTQVRQTSPIEQRENIYAELPKQSKLNNMLGISSVSPIAV